MKKAATCVMQIAANCFMIIYYLKTYLLSFISSNTLKKCFKGNKNVQNIIKDTENGYTRSHFSVLLLTFSFFRPLQQMGYWAIY